MPEIWWQETLREALLVRLIVSPNPSALQVLSDSLRNGVRCVLNLQHEQKSPLIRMTLLAWALEAKDVDPLVAAVLRDTCKQLAELRAVREEVVHPDNEAEIGRLREPQDPPAPLPSRIQLTRLARDIGVQAVAHRRIYHMPVDALVPSDDVIGGLVERAKRWDGRSKTALMSCLLLGRVGRHVLQTNNIDPYCRLVKAGDGEVWIDRVLPPRKAFQHLSDGAGYCPVSRQLLIPLPRVLGNALFDVCRLESGVLALSELSRRIREYSRDSGHALTVGSLTNCMEVCLAGC